MSSIFALPGTLIAYSSLNAPMILRMHATMAANIWSLYRTLLDAGGVSDALPTREQRSVSGAVCPAVIEQAEDCVKSLTMELSGGCLSLSLLRSGLLLCLMGPIKMPDESNTQPNGSPPEARASLPNGVGVSVSSATPTSVGQDPAGPGGSESSATIQQLLRTKAEALTKSLDQELAAFKMPRSA